MRLRDMMSIANPQAITSDTATAWPFMRFRSRSSLRSRLGSITTLGVISPNLPPRLPLTPSLFPHHLRSDDLNHLHTNLQRVPSQLRVRAVEKLNHLGVWAVLDAPQLQ